MISCLAETSSMAILVRKLSALFCSWCMSLRRRSKRRWLLSGCWAQSSVGSRASASKTRLYLCSKVLVVFLFVSGKNRPKGQRRLFLRPVNLRIRRRGRGDNRRICQRTGQFGWERGFGVLIVSIENHGAWVVVLGVLCKMQAPRCRCKWREKPSPKPSHRGGTECVILSAQHAVVHTPT